MQGHVWEHAPLQLPYTNWKMYPTCKYTTENQSFSKSAEKPAELRKSCFVAGNFYFLRKILKENLKIKDFIQKKGHEPTFYIVRHLI